MNPQNSAETSRKLSEFLTSRLAHDLVGPIGAMVNGLELFAEDRNEEVISALRRAADTAAARLRFFRLAFGQAGNVIPKADELFSVLNNYFADRNIRTSFNGDIKLQLPEGLGKLFLLSCLLLSECMPLGGALIANFKSHGAGQLARPTILLNAEAATLLADRLWVDVLLARGAATLSLANAPAVLLQNIAQAYNIRLTPSVSDKSIGLNLLPLNDKSF